MSKRITMADFKKAVVEMNADADHSNDCDYCGGTGMDLFNKKIECNHCRGFGAVQ